MNAQLILVQMDGVMKLKNTRQSNGKAECKRLVMHCDLRDYEMSKVNILPLEQKSCNFSSKMAIFGMLPKKFSNVLNNGTILRMTAKISRF